MFGGLDLVSVAIFLLIVIPLGVAWAISWGDAVDRRRAWNLWLAGLITDEELRRRLD